MDGSRFGVERAPETDCSDWQTFLRRLMEIDPPSTPVRRLKALRDPVKPYYYDEFTALVNTFFSALRSYLIQKNDQHALTIFEGRVHEAMETFDQKLILEPASRRASFAIDVLSYALRDVNFNWVKSHRLFYSRLQIEALTAGMRRLDNLVVIKRNPVVQPPVQSPTPPRSTLPNTANASVPKRSPYRDEPRLSVGPDSPPISKGRGRYAIGAILAVAAVGIVSRNEQPVPVTYATPVPDVQRSNVARRENAPINQEIDYFRHWGTIVDPVRPHTSVVIPTLTAVFNQYPTRLARCYSTGNALNVHSATELAAYVANNRQAHSLVQSISRRRGNRHLTVWWTENCHDIVIAPGHHLSFGENIRPRPVTVYFTPQSH